MDNNAYQIARKLQESANKQKPRRNTTMFDALKKAFVDGKIDNKGVAITK